MAVEIAIREKQDATIDSPSSVIAAIPVTPISARESEKITASAQEHTKDNLARIRSQLDWNLTDSDITPPSENRTVSVDEGNGFHAQTEGFQQQYQTDPFPSETDPEVAMRLQRSREAIKADFDNGSVPVAKNAEISPAFAQTDYSQIPQEVGQSDQGGASHISPTIESPVPDTEQLARLAYPDTTPMSVAASVPARQFHQEDKISQNIALQHQSEANIAPTVEVPVPTAEQLTRLTYPPTEVMPAVVGERSSAVTSPEMRTVSALPKKRFSFLRFWFNRNNPAEEDVA